MKKELVFIQVCPIDKYFIWQVHLWLESLKEIGKSNKAVSLIYVPHDRGMEIENWKQVMDNYPEAQFHFYHDEHNLNNLIGFYIPILRPYCLMRHFKKYPELKEKAIFYCDSDVIFLNKLDIDKYVDDDISYLSDTKSYIAASYFDSKEKDVLPQKLDAYKGIDVLDSTCKLVGISREVAVKNEDSSGGAQYLLKNIDADFWEKVLTDCIKIRTHLQAVNRLYFANESKGFQSWCCDMWAVLWGLWYRNQETKVVPEMEFAWSSDNISRLDKPNVGILHNAGIVTEKQGDIPVFYKGKYTGGNSPFEDVNLYKNHLNEKTKTLCNWYYIDKLMDLKNKYNLK